MRTLLFLFCVLPVTAAEPVVFDSTPLPHDVPLRRFGGDRFRFTGSLCTAAMSPDGKRLAVLSAPLYLRRTAAVTIFDAATGQPLVVSRVPRAGDMESTAMAFAPDGRFLAVVASPETAFVIATDTGREVWRNTGKQNIFCAFDPLGRLILTNEAETRVIDIPSGKLAATWPVGGIEAVTPDAKTYVRPIAQHTAVEIGDTATGTPRTVLPLKTDSYYHRNRFTIAHDGRTLAVLHAHAEIHLIDLATGDTRRTWKLPKGDPDHLEFSVTPDIAHSLAFAPDDRRLFHFSHGQIHSWELDPFRERPTVNRGDWYGGSAFAFTADGGTILIPRRSVVERWSAATGERIPDEFPRGGEAFAITHDGRQLVVGNAVGHISAWNARTGAFLRTVVPPPNTPYRVQYLSVSPDGRYVATREHYRDFKLFPLNATAHPLNPTAYRAAGYTSLAWSPDARFLYGWHTEPMANDSHYVEYDVANRRNSKVFVTNWPATISPDGRDIIHDTSPLDSLKNAGSDVHAIDVATNVNRPLYLAAQREKSNRYPVSRISVSPDESVIAAIRQGHVELLGSGLPPIESGDEVPDGRHWRYRHWTLAFTPNGRWLVTGGEDASVKVWEVATGKLVRRFNHDLGVNHVAVAPDGRSVFAGEEYGSLYQWDLTPPPAAGTPDELWKAALNRDPAVAVPAAWAMMGDAKRRAFAMQKLPPVAKADAAKVAVWIRDLDAPAFADRQAAKRELEALGRKVEAELRDALAKTASAEARERLEGLLARFDRTYSAEELAALRLVEACEWLRVPEPLTAWAAGAPSAVLTREAKAALARLEIR